jgi:putative serine protease PepD
MSDSWESEPGPTPPTVAGVGPAFGTPSPQPTSFAPAGSPTGAPPPSFGWPTVAPTPPPPSPSSSPPPNRQGGGRRVALALLASAGLVAAGFGVATVASDHDVNIVPTSAAVAPTATQPPGRSTTPQVQGTTSPDWAASVAETLSPAVVLIRTQSGLGSGTIYDASGLILTNAHVVGESSKVTVQLKDGSKAEGEVLGADAAADVAVVKIDPPTDMAVARISTDQVKVGQGVVALGSPFGLDQTVTAGIVSAVDRPVNGEQGAAVNMIQTDAPINPGNSGGALANSKGELIGVPSAIYSQDGENNGIGFAIPIQTAKALADRIASGQSIDHGYLGVSTQDDEQSPGATVVQVQDGAPAADAGIEQGDVIVSADGRDIRSKEDLSALIAGKSAGDEVELEVTRNGRTTTITVTLGKRPAQSSGKSQGGSGNSQGGSGNSQGGSGSGGQPLPGTRPGG